MRVDVKTRTQRILARFRDIRREDNFSRMIEEAMKARK